MNIVNTSGQLIRKISYAGGGYFSLSDVEPAAYAQDHWMLNAHFAMDTGVRFETQSLTYTSRIAPRWGLSWSPSGSSSTVFRGGLGVFYDSVPLDTYAFTSLPEQVITTYDGTGYVTDGPRQYQNIISQSALSAFPLIHQQSRSGNFAPYNVAWNLEGEHSVNSYISVRLRYLHADGRNQITLSPLTSASQNAMVLAGTGTLQSHQFELTSRLGASKEREIFLSYVRQFAGGSISDASSYLGDFPFPVVRPQISARTPGEFPNRLLLWGTANMPWRIHLSPHIEYRNGFTWQPVDVLQNYVSTDHSAQPRYPAYFVADLRVAKDLNINPQHAVRLSLTFRNLTNHNNPLQVHNNIADPQYGSFLETTAATSCSTSTFYFECY